MKTAKRLALAVALAGVALTACSPSQIGAAAIVGDKRITTTELDADLRELQQALSENPQAMQQLENTRQQAGATLPQLMLYRLVEAERYAQLAERAGVTVTDGEIDSWISRQGGAEAIETAMLSGGVAPSQSREYLRSLIASEKLVVQRGGGTDQDAVQRGQQAVAKELEAIKVSYNPRYGAFDVQQGFLRSDRFASSGD
ncbi:SurA N-terminal domain-containing protein [Thermostaphylospora chromogena]|uniref:Peptidyl-prolyl cis-trans isomerase SurA n=1 Tax=Thermostaphylospora chromogena TaxID=35622 RepID=A0A1H1B953_9ACTN|nr:SurA N-terminal domain-containing protein [Thermostaphylospora chromogena]SDQ48484.1 peptidyl-prolyl cis-trans isomerase SurA [Thermostaphylospora chromogena]